MTSPNEKREAIINELESLTAPQLEQVIIQMRQWMIDEGLDPAVPRGDYLGTKPLDM